MRVVIRLQTAAEVDCQRRARSQPLQCAIVHNVGSLRAVKVHQMQPSASGALHRLRHLKWIFVIDSLRVVVAARKPYALALDNIYCRYNLYHNSKKFCNMRDPTSPLFSG